MRWYQPRTSFFTYASLSQARASDLSLGQTELRGNELGEN